MPSTFISASTCPRDIISHAANYAEEKEALLRSFALLPPDRRAMLIVVAKRLLDEMTPPPREGTSPVTCYDE